MARSLEHPGRWLWVAAGRDGVLGFGRLAALAPPEGEPGPPRGLYLGGVSVARERRRRGIGHALTAARLRHAFVELGAERVLYFTNARNRASIALHAAFGFAELERPMRDAPVSFTGGVGILYALDRGRWAAAEASA